MFIKHSSDPDLYNRPQVENFESESDYRYQNLTLKVKPPLVLQRLTSNHIEDDSPRSKNSRAESVHSRADSKADSRNSKMSSRNRNIWRVFTPKGQVEEKKESEESIFQTKSN